MAMILFVCECGQRIMHSDKRQPVCTRCRDPKPAQATVCTHRGPRLGQASCGCGAVYHCNLLGIYCGNKQPLEFADFKGTILDETNFRCCRGCAEFVSAGRSFLQ